MKKQIILPLLALACLAACSSDEEEVTPANDTPLPMTVEVTENAMTDENGARKQAATRGTEITGETLSAFSMNYQENKYDFSKEGTTWTQHTWPNVDEKIDFYAYNDGTFIYNSGNPYVSFTVDNTPASQKDLLVATHKQISYNETKGVVTLAFDHACAAVKFTICKTAGVGDKAVVIKSVELSGVKNSGYYYYNNDESSKWQEASGTATYTLTNSDITLTTEPVDLPCGYLFLIPQDKSGLTLTVNYTVGGEAKEWSHTWNSGSWAEGTSYIVEINM